MPNSADCVSRQEGARSRCLWSSGTRAIDLFSIRIGLPASGLLLYEDAEAPFRFRFAVVDAFFAALLHGGQNSANGPPARRALVRPELFRQTIEEFRVHPVRILPLTVLGTEQASVRNIRDRFSSLAC